VGFQWGLAWTLTSLGIVVEALGSNEEALRLHERAVSICREIGHKWGTAYCLTNLANVLIKLNLFLEMRAALVEALRISLEIHTVPLALNIIMSFAQLMQVAFAHEYAAELVAFVLKHPAVEAETVTRAGMVLAELTAVLTPDQLAAAQVRGEARTMDEITNQIMRSDDALAE
jgi:hypothetical protein